MVPFFEAKTTHTHGRSTIITHEENWGMLPIMHKFNLTRYFLCTQGDSGR